MQHQPTIIPKVANFDKSPTSEQTNAIIQNTAFFPEIALIDVRNAMRIDGSVTNERLTHALIDAMATVNRDLKTYRQQHQANDKQHLAECDDETINNQSLLEYQYKRAVYSLATANLYERYRSFDSTKEGNDKADELLNTVGDLRRDYHFAIRDILDSQRVISELI